MKKGLQVRAPQHRAISAVAALLIFIAASPAPYGRAQNPQAASATGKPSTASGVVAGKSAASATTGAITDVVTAVAGGKLTVSVTASGAPLMHESFALSDPPRLVIDFPNMESRVPKSTQRIDAAKVRQLRIRQFQAANPMIARLVLDLEPGHGSYRVFSDKQTLRVEFDAPRIAAGPTAAAARKREAPPSAPKSASPAVTSPEQGQPVIEKQVQAPAKGSHRGGPVAAEPQPVVAKAAPKRTYSGPEVAQPSGDRSLPPAGDSRGSDGSATGAAIKEAPAAIPFEVSIPSAAEPPSHPTFGHPLTLDLVDISLVDFFRLMAEEGGINIVMDPEIKGTISIKVVKVPWDQIFEAALLNNALDKQIEGNLVRIARKSTLQDEAKQQEALKRANMLAADVTTRIKRLNYAKASMLLPALADQKTVRGTVVVDERTNSLILTDLPASLDRMSQLIESLDTPQPQVEIEARIVSATRDFARDIGVQFGFVQGNLERVTVGGPNTFGTIGGTRPSATPTNTFAAGNPFTGRGASESDATESGGVSTGAGENNAGNFNVNLPARRAFGGVGISVGNIFDTFLLDAAITAGENRGLAKLISQPKVTAQNNNAAVITQGLRFPVQIIANNTVTVQFQNAALTLTVTPQITYEGNIVLDLKVENNTPDFSRQVNGIPSIRTSESTTRVLVSDGGTTVIGGILIDNETTQEDRVPGLASLPLIGNVFKRSAVAHSTQEVLFFITPKIIK
jgi:type IV pilus assembly protein PilQ